MEAEKRSMRCGAERGAYQLPFQIRDAVPGDKSASARIFLAEAPDQALRDMCFYLQISETGNSDDLVTRIVDYFSKKYGDSKRSQVSETETGVIPTPVRTASSLPADESRAAASTGNRRWKRKTPPQKREEPTTEEKESKNEDDEAPKPEAKKQKRAKEVQKETPAQEEAPAEKDTAPEKQKSTENLQDEYCVPGLSIAQQIKMALKMSMGQ